MRFLAFTIFSVLIGQSTEWTILSHPFNDNPYEAECLDDCCEDIEILEFGVCGNTVVLDRAMSKLTILRIRFERIFEVKH